jgi:hypothetical protein
MTKMFEMIFEAIPGCIMQLFVLVKSLKDGGTVDNQAVLSLVVSALSTGYSSGTITYDFDTSVQRRKNEPEFYGFIPDGTRGTVVFGCMILNGALLLLARSASAALLMHAKSSYFLYYTLGDCAFFFLQKAARGDIRCFVNMDGWAGTVSTDFFSHLFTKLVTDYTGLVQFRGPGVQGGCYWTMSMVGDERERSENHTLELTFIFARAGPGPRRSLRRRRHLLLQRRIYGRQPRRVHRVGARLLVVRRLDPRLPPLPRPHELLPPPHLLLHADVQGVGVQLLHQGGRHR